MDSIKINDIKNQKKNRNINLLTIMFIFMILSDYFSNVLKILFYAIQILLLIYLYIIKKTKYRVSINLKYKKYIGFFIFMYILSFILNFNNNQAIAFSIKMMIFLLIIYRIFKVYGEFYIVNFFYDIMKIMFVLNAISLFEYIGKTNFFYQHLLAIPEGRYSVIGTSDMRLFSIFKHPIVYGNMLVINFSIIYFLKKSYNKIFYWLNIIVIIINLYGTKSRSSWIAFIFILVNLFFVNINMKKNIKLKTLVIYMFFVVFIIVFIINFNEIINNIINNILARFLFEDGSNLSKVQRLGAINNVLDSINKNPINILIGNGVYASSTFMLNNTVILKNASFMDNMYLTAIYNFGFLFVYIYILYLIGSLIQALKNKNVLKNMSANILLAISVNMFFYEALHWLIPLFIFLIVNCFNIFDVEDYK